MKLYVLPPSPNSFKVVALAQHLGLDLEVQPVDLQQGQHRQPEYLALNPNGLTPTLQDGSFVLWESNAIMSYLAQKKPESGLYPQDAQGQALVQQWLHWQDCHWAPALQPFVFQRLMRPLFFGQPTDEEAVAKAVEPFHKAASVLEGQLSKSPFLVGQNLTVADFAVGLPLFYAAPARLPWDNYPKLRDYAQRLLALPAVVKALPPMPTLAKG